MKQITCLQHHCHTTAGKRYTGWIRFHAAQGHFLDECNKSSGHDILCGWACLGDRKKSLPHWVSPLVLNGSFCSLRFHFWSVFFFGVPTLLQGLWSLPLSRFPYHHHQRVELVACTCCGGVVLSVITARCFSQWRECETHCLISVLPSGLCRLLFPEKLTLHCSETAKISPLHLIVYIWPLIHGEREID